MKRAAMLVLSLCVVTACGQAKPPAPAMTEREKTDAIGRSALPGAAGIRAAQRLADSASARRARLDSIARQP